jgi:ATP-dependent DNA helicase RecQ
MNHYFDALQKLLLAENPDFRDFQRHLKKKQQQLANVELAQSHLLLRTAMVWRAFLEDRAGTGDLAVLLRQVMRVFAEELLLTQTTWQQLVRHQHDMSLRVVDENEQRVRLRALSWESAWLTGTKDIDRLVGRRPDTSVPGDGLLYALSKGQFGTYRSAAQKTAVAASLFAPPGSTTLITLPTGGGKSLCVLLPAWFESHGGRRKGGTTLVIVPTVALAYDQQENARAHFTPASDAYKPYCLTGDTPKEIRSIIYRGISEGTLPILYTSPESLLLNPILYHTCLEAAANGNLRRFVIDEAHLVDSWGASFRTEFQLLGAYKKKLLQASNGALRTFLLSATVSYQSERTLAEFFAPESDLSLVLANQLRPEPSYWFHHTRYFSTQRICVIDALHHLPRPAILYVTKPSHAQSWVRILKQAGFQRVVSFTGRTTGGERQRILADWNQNKIDIIVGNSAFGLGVDKGDIRTIIHATLPENIDRYYQEVGRGGRDGCSSTSILISKDDDFELAFSMTTKSRITIEKAWSRWRGMWLNSLPYGQTIDKRLINLNAKPTYDLEMRESEASRDWNEHILLFMQRAGVLSIEDTRPDEGSLDREQSDPELYPDNFWILVRVQNDRIVNDESAFEALMEEQREAEKESIKKNLEALSEVIKAQTQTQPEHCLGYDFAELYPHTAVACGGCAYCRQTRQIPYAQALRAYVELENWPAQSVKLDPTLHQRLGDRQTVIIAWDLEKIEDFAVTLTALLVEAGIEQIVLPDHLYENKGWIHNLITQLARHKYKRQRLIGTQTVDESGLFPIPTVVFYPLVNGLVDKLYNTIQREFGVYANPIPLIHVVHQAAWLSSENGRFLERVNGLKLTPTEVENLFAKSQTSLY